MINHFHRKILDPSYQLPPSLEPEFAMIIGHPYQPPGKVWLTRHGTLETALWGIRLAFSRVTWTVLNNDYSGVIAWNCT